MLGLDAIRRVVLQGFSRVNSLKYRLFGKCARGTVGMYAVLLLEAFDGASRLRSVCAVHLTGIVPQRFQAGLDPGDIVGIRLFQGLALHVEIVRIILKRLRVRIRRVVTFAGIEQAQE